MSLSFLAPPRPKPLLPENEIAPAYKRLRLQSFIGIFLGYAGYYLVRKNFSMAMPELISQGYSKTDLGFAFSAVSIAYGISKFLMGNVSDRSDSRKFLALGLALSALCMIFMGLVPFATSSIAVMFVVLFLNGWFQGMGWPPCGRVLVHWFSKKERGVKVSIWNVAHNVGGGLVGPMALLGLALFAGDWRSNFYFPGLVALALAFIAYFLVRDTPQSCGLPRIEDYKNEPVIDTKGNETELTARQIFMEYVFNNRALWIIALANVFIYMVRYGVLDWAPTYLSEAKGFSLKGSGWAYFAFEYAGIPGTILCGWISDKVFKGKRVPALIIYMVLVMIAVIIYWKNPAGNPAVDIACLIAVGFLIYGPVMLIGVQALDMVPKKAAGTAAGFTGLFGYLIGAVAANVIVGMVVDKWGWDGGFMMLIAACVLTIILTLFTVKDENKRLALLKAN